MTYRDFIINIYVPIKNSLKSRSIDKVEKMTAKEKMVMAIGDAAFQIDSENLKELKYIYGDKPVPKLIEEIERQSKFWQVDKTKLIVNLKKMFL